MRKGDLVEVRGSTYADDGVLYEVCEVWGRHSVIVLGGRGHVYSRDENHTWIFAASITKVVEKPAKRRTDEQLVKLDGEWHDERWYWAKCREVWSWLAEHPDKDKGNYPFYPAGAFIENKCYACHYYIGIYGDVDDDHPEPCQHCPLGQLHECCCEEEGPYERWNRDSFEVDWEEDFDTFNDYLAAAAREIVEVFTEKEE